MSVSLQQDPVDVKVNAKKINKKTHQKLVQNSFKEIMNPVGWGQCHLFPKPRVEKFI